MPDIQIDAELLAAAIKGLRINAPVYRAVKREDGVIEITTRVGVQEWLCPEPVEEKPPVRRKRKAK